MPYRINPNDPTEVQVKKNGRWQLKKKFTSKAKAKAHWLALKLNVKGHGKK